MSAKKGTAPTKPKKTRAAKGAATKAKRATAKPRASETPPSADAGYTVLARRYRPVTFGDVVGQEPVARSLSNAIQDGRVAHAYLFCGMRGVGKTSMARILAKALNCQKGPTVTPCNQCDICQGIGLGEDVDVLEIDGASNRGIDEVREIRQNVGYRPARARHKIYIIDEVHMLTKEAFNALLKTLEEPPPHVKFVFATTEPQKIPATIESRCQRFDFRAIAAHQIAERIDAIVRQEKLKVDADAVALLARRAQGSLRDALSLLDQVLAFGSEQITVEDVHALLGTATDDRMIALVERFVQRDTAGALQDVDQAVNDGINLAELVNQLLDYFRDLMVSASCGTEAALLSVSTKQAQTVLAQSKQLGLETVLAGMEILADTKYRMRTASAGRTVLEMALVRLCQLEDLAELSGLVSRLEQLEQRLGHATGAGPTGGPARSTPRGAGPGARVAPQPATRSCAGESGSPPGGTAPTSEPVASGPGAAAPSAAVDLSAVTHTWQAFLKQLTEQHGSKLTALVGEGRPVDVRGSTVVVGFASEFGWHKQQCETFEKRSAIQGVLVEMLGQSVSVEFVTDGQAAPRGAGPSASPTPSTPANAAPRPAKQGRYRQEMQAVLKEPLVRKALDVFDARIVHVEPAGS